VPPANSKTSRRRIPDGVTTDRPSPWIVSMRRGDRARIRRRLFCFPYAGGGASIYRKWAGSLHDDVELCAMQLPGREDRLSEPPCARLSEMIPRVIEQLSPYTDLPFAFFGHSLGALIAFELTRTLRDAWVTQPAHLFVSGRRAPHLPARRAPLYDLPQAEFEAALADMQGTPRAVLDNRELMDLMTPLLRVDLALNDTYTCARGPALDVPISVFGGSDDGETTREELDAWRQHTRAFAGVRVFPGHHFYLHDHVNALAQAIQDAFTPASAPPPAP
jgi:medium-chain acyl-[acyl-carrier-protein] hydrolase